MRQGSGLNGIQAGIYWFTNKGVSHVGEAPAHTTKASCMSMIRFDWLYSKQIDPERLLQKDAREQTNSSSIF